MSPFSAIGDDCSMCEYATSHPLNWVKIRYPSQNNDLPSPLCLGTPLSLSFGMLFQPVWLVGVLALWWFGGLVAWWPGGLVSARFPSPPVPPLPSPLSLGNPYKRGKTQNQYRVTPLNILPHQPVRGSVSEIGELGQGGFWGGGFWGGGVFGL